MPFRIDVINGSTITASYCDIQGGWTGTGNINADPLFSNTLFHLGHGSPCINTGHPSLTCSDSDGTRNNMGVYGGIADRLIQHITGLFENSAIDLIPQEYSLSQNYPNPFNPSTKIKYTLPKTEKVTIEVFNLLGQKVEPLLNKQMPAGNHEVKFNGKNLSSGVYLYRIRAGEYQQVRKMILLR